MPSKDKDDLKLRFNDYMRRMRSAVSRHCHGEGIYAGSDGCDRFAREVGYAIPDFSRDADEINDLIKSTYSGICVIAYNLSPPVDAGRWIKNLRKGIQRRLEYDRTRDVFVPTDDYKPHNMLNLDSVTAYKLRNGLE